MHVSIRRYQTPSPAEVTEKVKAGFLPLIAKAPGFIAYYAVDGGGGQWVSISVFETKAGADDSARLAADWAKANVAAHLTGKPDITAGEVVAHVKK